MEGIDSLDLAVSKDSSKDNNKIFTDTIPKVQTRNWPRIWAIGGGKGGVGKSLISANFSWLLAQEGKRVLAVDLDLGGSNLHTCLGVEPPRLGLSDWIHGRCNNLLDLTHPTLQPGLHMISGASDSITVTSHMEDRKRDLFAELTNLPFDEIVLDLGAGSHPLTVDFFNCADEGVLSILPEPTSVENAYRFIRVAFYRRLLHCPELQDFLSVIHEGAEARNTLGVRSPNDLKEIIARIDPKAGAAFEREIAKMRPNIVVNQVRTSQDIEIGKSICGVSRRYFGIDARYVGYVDYENSVWKAVRLKRPAVAEFPRSILAARIARLTKTLLGEESALFPR
ncbi:MAG: P-loop NTPase [Bdellovibrionota bacterium]